MSLPGSHGAMAATVYVVAKLALNERPTFWGVVGSAALGVLPDADTVHSFVHTGNSWELHRHVTHTPKFAAIIGGIIAAAQYKTGSVSARRALKTGLISALAVFSHTVLDWMVDMTFLKDALYAPVSDVGQAAPWQFLRAYLFSNGGRMAVFKDTVFAFLLSLPLVFIGVMRFLRRKSTAG